MRWKFSHLKNSRASRRASAVLEERMGVRWAAPARRALAASISLYWRSVVVMAVFKEGSGGGRQGQADQQAAAFAVAHFQAGVVAADHALDDGQSQPGAVGLAARRVQAREG